MVVCRGWRCCVGVDEGWDWWVVECSGVVGVVLGWMRCGFAGWWRVGECMDELGLAYLASITSIM